MTRFGSSPKDLPKHPSLQLHGGAAPAQVQPPQADESPAGARQGLAAYSATEGADVVRTYFRREPRAARSLRQNANARRRPPIPLWSRKPTSSPADTPPPR